MVSGELKSSLISLLLFVLRELALVSSANLQRHVLFVLFFNTESQSVWLTVLLKTLSVWGRLINWDKPLFCFRHHLLLAVGCPSFPPCCSSSRLLTTGWSLHFALETSWFYLHYYFSNPSLTLCPHLHGLLIAGGVTVPCAPHCPRAGAELWWCSGVVCPQAPLVPKELGKQCCPSLSHPGVPALLVQGAGRALVVPWAFGSTCHGAELWGVCASPFLRQNNDISAFWHWFLTKDSRHCSCAGFLVPSPTLLQCVLFWNTQFSYKQSTLSTTCFCTFWNGALRQINESKYGSLPVKILQTVSSQGHWLRQHIILFTVETENPFLPIQ